jgi:hypothetical protein
MLLVSLYILSVPLQEASELPVVLVLHDHTALNFFIFVAEVFDHTVEQ